MKVDMNGLRKQLTSYFNWFCSDELLKKLDDDDTQYLIGIRRMIGALNRIYSDNKDDLMDNLGDLELKKIIDED